MSRDQLDPVWDKSREGARTGAPRGVAIRDDDVHDLDPAGHATTRVVATLVGHGPRPTSSLDMHEMKRVGLIGCGAIGRPVARALLAGKAGAHSLAALLAGTCPSPKPHPSSLGAILDPGALTSRPSVSEGDQLFQSAARARTRWICDGWAESKQARVERPPVEQTEDAELSYAA